MHADGLLPMISLHTKPQCRQAQAKRQRPPATPLTEDDVVEDRDPAEAEHDKGQELQEADEPGGGVQAVCCWWGFAAPGATTAGHAERRRSWQAGVATNTHSLAGPPSLRGVVLFQHHGEPRRQRDGDEDDGRDGVEALDVHVVPLGSFGRGRLGVPAWRLAGGRTATRRRARPGPLAPCESGHTLGYTRPLHARPAGGEGGGLGVHKRDEGGCRSSWF
jgi:hypothetical protein